MKKLTVITFLLACFTLISFSQDTTKSNLEKNLKMTITFERANKQNVDDIIRLYLTNLSKTDKYKIIMPGDGSEAAWREPYIYFTAEFKEGNGIWSKLEKLASYRSCGMFDAEWQEDTLTINPKQKIQIYYMASENIIKFFDIPSSGTIRLTGYYDYEQGKHPKEHANEIPSDFKKIIEQGNYESIKNIPSFILTSDAIEITIKK